MTLIRKEAIVSLLEGDRQFPWILHPMGLPTHLEREKEWVYIPYAIALILITDRLAKLR